MFRNPIFNACHVVSAARYRVPKDEAYHNTISKLSIEHLNQQLVDRFRLFNRRYPLVKLTTIKIKRFPDTLSTVGGVINHTP